MFVVLFLGCEILLKCLVYLSRTFLFCTLERVTIKQTGHHVCLLDMHAHVYKINASICHASDTGQNYLNKKCFLQSWNWLLLLWHFPLISDIFKRGFHTTESFCIQRKENDNVMNLFVCFLRKKNCFFSVWILHIQKETNSSSICLLAKLAVMY